MTRSDEPTRDSRPDSNETLSAEQYQRLGEVFERVLECGDSSERAAVLDKECGDDALLRARVESLMLHDRELDDLPDPTEVHGDDETPIDPGERYRIDGEIGRGGMGRVLLAYDHELRRHIAMKVIPGNARSELRVERLSEEAQATAQLEHPNIAPLYDVAHDVSGTPFFTMKWIRGRDLDEILRSGEVEFTLIRLVQILQQVAMGVDFAHNQGVVHRDLKPENVMVGDYGEVLVVDWGVAKVRGQEDRTDSAVSTNRSVSGETTMDGFIMGSLSYMAPEQASGESSKVTPVTDVFGLGGMLYAILTGCSLYDGESFDDRLRQAREGEIIPPGERVPERPIPPELEAICVKALSFEQGDRHTSAREFHAQLQGYVEGRLDAERRAAEAARLLVDADRLRDELEGLRSRGAVLLAEEERLRARIRDHDPSADKQPLWDVLGEAAAVREESTRLFGETTAAYQAVLSIQVDNPEAKGALADLFFDRLQAAEDKGDLEATHVYEGLVHQYEDGRYAELLSGECDVEIRSDPAGAEVLLSRYRDAGLRLVESEPVVIGSTPVRTWLSVGSYVAILRKADHVDVRYPFLLRRRQKHDATVSLHADGTIPAGFVQIPAGESILGGDTRQFVTWSRSVKQLSEFFLSRFPVTFAEYCEFLDECIDGQEPLESSELIPKWGSQPYVSRDADGTFSVLSNRGADASTLLPSHPVVAVTRDAMQRYCDWLGERIGKTVRLPSEEQWERAARGADGRTYPWGNGFDWSFAKGGRSRDGQPSPEPVGAFALDLSPFGVQDLSGGVRELCDYVEDPSECWFRGGSWFQAHPMIFRADVRTQILAGKGSQPKTVDMGFRVAFEL